jgi:formamidopyrimidine-DNA glycosylase
VPELPEVETVRDGLSRFVLNRPIIAVQARHPRAIRRQLAGAEDFAAALRGTSFAAARRRGKYLWLPLDADRSGARSLVAHLGMSGQLLVQPRDTQDEKHLHVRIEFADGGPELRFVDQRTFGGLMIDELVASGDGPDAVPAQVSHIARDPLDPLFDDDRFVRRTRLRHTEVKRALLDQTLISGIGNIYADESLWRARLNGARITDSLTRPVLRSLLAAVREVLTESLRQGGTSFDSLYVNVNGQGGYFERDLAVYGREGRPCPRCGRAIVRTSFMNRSSFHCPRCQRPPRLVDSVLPQ